MEIGSYVQICTHCFLGCSRGIVVEDFTGVGPGTRIFSASDDYSGEFLNNMNVPSEFKGGTIGKVTISKHVIIGANSYDNGQTNEGCAFVFYGSATGLSSTPDWTGDSNQADSDYGRSVASAGDVNGDGYSDITAKT